MLKLTIKPGVVAKKAEQAMFSRIISSWLANIDTWAKYMTLIILPSFYFTIHIAIPAVDLGLQIAAGIGIKLMKFY